MLRSPYVYHDPQSFRRNQPFIFGFACIQEHFAEGHDSVIVTVTSSKSLMSFHILDNNKLEKAFCMVSSVDNTIGIMIFKS